MISNKKTIKTGNKTLSDDAKVTRNEELRNTTKAKTVTQVRLTNEVTGM